MYGAYFPPLYSVLEVDSERNSEWDSVCTVRSTRQRYAFVRRTPCWGILQSSDALF